MDVKLSQLPIALLVYVEMCFFFPLFLLYSTLLLLIYLSIHHSFLSSLVLHSFMQPFNLIIRNIVHLFKYFINCELIWNLWKFEGQNSSIKLDGLLLYVVNSFYYFSSPLTLTCHFIYSKSLSLPLSPPCILHWSLKKGHPLLGI